MRKTIILLLLFAASLIAHAQTGALSGYCNLGGAHAKTSGLSASNFQQGIIPHCTITVYLTGSTTLATIYSNGASTPLANPFTANASTSTYSGAWTFWASTNAGLDVIGSGGDAPNTYPAPVPLCVDCFVSESLNPQSGLISINAQTGPAVDLQSADGSVGITVPSTNVINLKALGTSFEMLRTPPVNGQYVVVPANSFTQTFGSGCTTEIMKATNTSLIGIRGPVGGLCSTSMNTIWSGFNLTLPSYVNPANITAIYPFGTYSSTGGNNSLTCTYNSLNGVSVSPPQGDNGTAVGYTAPTPSGWGTDLSQVACEFFASGSSDPVFRNYSLYDMGLFVYYTGTAPPAPTALNVVPPLYVNNSDLGISLPDDVGTDIGPSANNYIVNLASYSNNTPITGTTIRFVPQHSSTAPGPVLNFNNLGNRRIVGPTGVDLVSGDLSTSYPAIVMYNGGQWQLQNPQVSSPSSISLTTTGTAGASTLSGAVLNIPQYQGQISLTTTGTSGAATLVGNTLNVPQYSAGGGSGITSINSQTGPAITVHSSDSSVNVNTTTNDIDLTTAGGGGSGNVSYPAANTTFYIFADSRGAVSSNCAGPSFGPITSSTVTGGVLTATASGGISMSTGAVLTLSGFAGGYAPLNGQDVVVLAAGLTSTQFEANVTGVADGTSGTGNFSCYYSPRSQLARMPYANTGTVIDGSIGNLTTVGAITDYPTLVHPSSPAVTGNPGYLIVQIGLGDLLLGTTCTVTTLEANLQKIWSLAHADGWKIIGTSLLPHTSTISSCGATDFTPQLKTVNEWMRKQLKSNYAVTGAASFCPAGFPNCYIDEMEDIAQLLPDAGDNYLYQVSTGISVGHLQDAGISIWAQDIAAALVGPGSIAHTPVNLFARTDQGNTFTQKQTISAGGLAVTGGITGDQITDTALTSGTSPICPNGGSGKFSNSGNCNVSVRGGTITYTATHTVAAADDNQLIVMNCSSACSLVLPATQPSATWSASVISIGSTTATVSLSGDTFNGGASAPVLNSYMVVKIQADSAVSTNYLGGTPIKAGTGISFVAAADGLTINSSGIGSVPIGASFNILSGVAASPAIVYQTAPNSGTVSGCTFTTATSDAAIDLVMNVKVAGTTIFTGSAVTVTHGSSAQTQSNFSLSSGTIAVTAGNIWELDITTGSSSWTGSMICH